MKTHFLRIICLLFLLVSCVMSGQAEAQAKERPNVVIFLADDQGWGDLSMHDKYQ